MANCFSLENTDELLERLHNCARSCVTDKALIYYDAIDAIEQLLAKNAKLKAEHDSAVADIIIACRGENTLCGMCRNKYCEYAGDNQTYCYKCSRFEWRGVQNNG